MSFISSQNRSFLSLVSVVSAATLSHSSAAVTYFLTGGSPFDNAGIGAFETLADPGGMNVTMTTIDIIGNDLTLASAGVANVTNVSGSIGSMGINSVSGGGFSSEFQDFNPNEGWIVSFNMDITLDEIDLSGQGAGAEMTVSSAAFTDKVLLDGNPGDTHNLGNSVVLAGTTVTFQMTSDSSGDNDTGMRIAYLTVSPAIPEPSSALLSVLALTLLGRRRR